MLLLEKDDIVIIICYYYMLLLEKDDKRVCIVLFLLWNWNSHNLETAVAHVIFVLHSAMITHLLTNQNARSIQIIL